MARINLTGAVLSATLLLSGCASLHQFTERHPVVSAVGATLIAGSIIATAEANGHSGRAGQQQGTVGTQLPCHPQPNGSCL